MYKIFCRIMMPQTLKQGKVQGIAKKVPPMQTHHSDQWYLEEFAHLVDGKILHYDNTPTTNGMIPDSGES